MNKKTQAVCLLLASALWARHPSALKPPTWINNAPWAALTVTPDKDTVYVDTTSQDIGIQASSNDSLLLMTVWGQQYLPHDRQVITYQYEFYITAENPKAPQWRVTYAKIANRRGDQLSADNTSTAWHLVTPGTIASNFYDYVKLRYVATVKAQRDAVNR